MLTVNPPHVIQASIERPAERIPWQVVFLPDSCAAISPSSFTALCPFTGVRATGATVQLAAYAWVKEARRRFPEHSFTIPKYILTTRKIWYGEDSDRPGEGVFAVDLHPLPRMVGFVPQRNTLIEVREGLPSMDASSSPLAMLETRLRESGDEMSGAVWAEFRVSCTPFMFSSTTGCSARLMTGPSLTPHCLN